MKLYEIAREMEQVESLLNDGVDPQAISDTLEAIEISFSDKLMSIGKIIKNNDAIVAGAMQEIERLRDRIKRIDSKSDWLRDYARNAMIATNRQKIETDIFTLSISKGRKSVKIEDDNKIPANFLNIKTVSTPDKKAIKEAIESGQIVSGASLVVGESSLTIK